MKCEKVGPVSSGDRKRDGSEPPMLIPFNMVRIPLAPFFGSFSEEDREVEAGPS